jgi:hypothetical protein
MWNRCVPCDASTVQVDVVIGGGGGGCGFDGGPMSLKKGIERLAFGKAAAAAAISVGPGD